MRVIKRGMASLWFYRKRNLLLALLLGGLFCLFFLTLSISISSGSQISHMRDTVGSSVVVQKKLVGSFFGTIGTFYEKEKEALTEHELVRDYNLVTSIGKGNWRGAEPYYVNEEKFLEYKSRIQENFGNTDHFGFFDTSSFFGVTNSEDYALFAGGGYHLEEGRPIAKEDEDKNVILISDVVAEKNQLHVGDKVMITASNQESALNFEREVTIQGIFSYPSSEGQEELDVHLWEHPANYTFLPEELLTELDRSSYPIEQIFVYLKDMDQLDRYIRDMEEKLGETFTDISQGEFRYDYYWDQSWYEQISGPFQEISRVTGVMAVLIAVGIYGALLLICAWLFRGKRRELGVVFAMGETRGRIAAQVLLEEIAPLLGGVFLGAAAAFAGMEPVSERVLDQSAGPEINRQLEGQREQVNRYENSGVFELRNDFLGEHFTVYRAPERLYLSDSMDGVFAWMGAGIAVLILSLLLQVRMMLRGSPAEILITGEA